jgi:hypothetical protein
MLWALQAATTWAMVGVIWFVQVVHYPLFESVGESEFSQYSARHSHRTTWVVLPLMSVELATATLFWQQQQTVLSTVGFGIVVVLWITTLLFYAPLHGRLAKGFDISIYSLLVRANWLRTWLWSARGVLVLFLHP